MDSKKPLKVVSIGGGTGQSVLLRALRCLDCEITAIVAMADDGGSTGILRKYSDIPAPGDIRKCLVSLSADPDSLLSRCFEHRLKTVDMHAMGNLALMSVYEETGSFPQAIAACEELLGCKGHVMPSTLDLLTLHGQTCDGRHICGQAKTSHGPCTMKRVWVEPGQCKAYQPAVDAILEADMVVLGPGSLFTSIIPNLLVPDIAQALRVTKAVCVFVCPKSDSQGETWGMRADEYVDALMAHGLSDSLDIVLLNKPRRKDRLSSISFKALVGDSLSEDTLNEQGYPKYRPVICKPEEIQRIEDAGVHTVVRDFDTCIHPYQHDVEVLSQVLKEILDCCHKVAQKSDAQNHESTQ